LDQATLARQNQYNCVSEEMSHKMPPLAPPPSLMAMLPVWFMTSVLFNFLTPLLVKMLDNQDVTFLELSVTVSFGFAILRHQGLPLLPPMSKLPKWLLLGMLHLIGCRCFVWGLSFIPVSLAQTIRASSPVVAVPISCAVFGERYSWQVLLPLLVILFGFALSVGVDVAGTNLAGCGAALASLCCLVLVNGGSKSENNNPLSMQFWVCMFAWLSLLPMWLYSGGPGRLGSLDCDRWRLAGLVLADGAMYYIEQAAQSQVLKELPFVSFAVTDTLRRLAIVCVSGFLIQGNPCTPQNGLGILLVLSGAISYNIMNARFSRSSETSSVKKSD